MERIMPKIKTIAGVLLYMPVDRVIDFLSTFEKHHNAVEYKSLVNSIFKEYHKTAVA